MQYLDKRIKEKKTWDQRKEKCSLYANASRFTVSISYFSDTRCYSLYPFCLFLFGSAAFYRNKASNRYSFGSHWSFFFFARVTFYPTVSITHACARPHKVQSGLDRRRLSFYSDCSSCVCPRQTRRSFFVGVKHSWQKYNTAVL